MLFPIFVAVWFIQIWYPNCLCKSCVLFPKSFRIVLFCELADKSNYKIEMTFLPDLHLNCVLNFKFLDLLSYHFLILNHFFWSILFAPHHWLQRQIRLVSTTPLRCLLVLFAVIWRPCVCNHFCLLLHAYWYLLIITALVNLVYNWHIKAQHKCCKLLKQSAKIKQQFTFRACRVSLREGRNVQTV